MAPTGLRSSVLPLPAATAGSGGGRSTRKQPVRTAGGGNAVLQHRRRLFFPFVLPAFAFYAVFLLLPLAGTVWISLNRWSGVGPMSFRGIKNYTHLFNDPIFLTSFGNSFKVMFIGGAATFICSFGLTMLMRELRGRGFARAVIFFPTIVPALVVSILWGFLFQSDGLINSFLRLLGVAHPPAWLALNNQFDIILLGIVWTSTGFYTTILMAAADQIPRYLYEDCDLAGASTWQKFRHVTLPLSWDVVGVCAVLWTINSLKTFEFILAISGSSSGLPDPSVWTVALYAYASAYGSEGVPDYGAAAASAIVTLALMAVLVGLIRRVMRREAIEL